MSKQTDLLNGVAKAWCCWNGTGTAVIRDSHGVSSLTDNGTGDYTFEYSNSFGSANYTIGGVFAFGSVITTYAYTVRPRENSAVAASNARLITVYVSASDNGIADYPYATFQAHGDLA